MSYVLAQEAKKDDLVLAFLSNPQNPFESKIPKPPPPPPVVNVVEKPVEKVTQVPEPPPKKVEIISQAALNVTINGIVWGGDKPQAILNGSIVKVGDIKDEMKVEGITDKGILISYVGEKYKGQKIVLKIDGKT